MKITNTTREGSKASVEMNIARDTLEQAKIKVYAKAKKNIMLPGFRKGHAPRKMVEAMYGEDVFLEDAIEEIFPEVFECLTESGLKVVGTPGVTAMDKQENGDLAIKLDVPLYPEVTLGQYKGLEVPKAEAEVKEEEIDAEIDRMAESVSRIETVERPAQLGDTANIDFEGFIDGVAFDGGKGEGFDLKLGSGQFIPGFEEQVVGMSAGEERDIDVTFPEDYHADMAGKPAVFHVKVNGVKETVRPALDDEFVKDVSEFDTMDALRADIRERFLKEKTDSIESTFKSAAIEAAASNVEADIPACMVDEELEYQMRQTAYQLQMSGMSMDQYAQIFGGEAQMRQTMRPNAERQVKTQVMLAKIAEVEGIEIPDEEIEAEYNRMAASYSMDVADVKARMGAEDVKTDLLARKAAALVADNAVAVAPKTEEAPAEA
ncbi:MAG: trigger factor [Ruminococcaceae bacterium]|jgi:trigger factor|nr:trigger factor [Oscillospiraceae bacterium]